MFPLTTVDDVAFWRTFLKYQNKQITSITLAACQCWAVLTTTTLLPHCQFLCVNSALSCRIIHIILYIYAFSLSLCFPKRALPGWVPSVSLGSDCLNLRPRTDQTDLWPGCQPWCRVPGPSSVREPEEDTVPIYTFLLSSLPPSFHPPIVKVQRSHSSGQTPKSRRRLPCQIP